MTDSDLAELDRKIAVMQAYRDGKVIQITNGRGNWRDDGSVPLIWNWGCHDYRVKPVEPRRLWVLSTPDGSGVTNQFSQYDTRLPSIQFIELTPEVREKLGL